MYCPVANESDHTQSKFHTVSGFTMQHFVILSQYAYYEHMYQSL